MTLYLRLAWRNVWRHRRRTIIIIGAMGLSLAMMMMYDGLIEGFNQAIYGNAIRVMGGNIQIHAAGYREKFESNPLLSLQDDKAVIQAALAQPGVISATRRIQTGGMVTNREGAFSLSIIGIDPEAEAPISLIEQNIADGRWLTSDDQDVVLIGRGLADEMILTVGDRITLVGSDINKQNRQRTMTVVGIYDIGVPTNEKNTLYISLGEAQLLYGLGDESTEVQVNIEQLGNEPAVVDALIPLLPGYEVESWEKNYPELKTTINRKSSVMNVFGVIIIAIAGIGILNLLLMAVYERTREIGLLGAMGLKPRQIATLFILEGTLIGVVGAATGAILGMAFNLTFQQIGFDYSSYADITEYMALITGKIYPTLGVENLFSRMMSVIVISTLAAWIPATEAARREPAEALHYV
jgi:ABC-type lipoprotein release transport system permease subunit